VPEGKKKPRQRGNLKEATPRGYSKGSKGRMTDDLNGREGNRGSVVDAIRNPRKSCCSGQILKKWTLKSQCQGPKESKKRAKYLAVRDHNNSRGELNAGLLRKLGG